MTGAHALPAGLRLGAYEIVSPLTSGGMAAVYLGRRVDSPSAGYVAIKVVHPRFVGDPAFVAMFLDEARLSARIQHPNVVRVEATGQENGLYYLVMEYLHGASLFRFVRRLAESKRALVNEVAVHVIGSVAAGLHAAHDTTDEQGRPLGIVHRDVTPQNILVSYAGGVKLIDFGIAKAAGRVHQTAKGMLKGKLRYMAPEQAAGRNVDRRTDVYALAIVLWEMLTYRKAFSAKTDAELVRMVLSPKLVPPSRLSSSVAPALDEVVMTGLAASPDERFQTALAFRNALYGALPAAAQVDDAHVASLLRTVLADDLAKDARTLPPSVVISQPRAVGAGSEEALTQVVASLVPDDDEPERTPPPQAPTPTPRVATHSSTVFGVGLAANEPPQGMPAPAPAASASSPAIMATRLSLRGPPQVHVAPQVAFTPPSGLERPRIPISPGAVAPDETPRGRAGMGAMKMLGIGCGMLLTILLGTALGWLVLHHATRMLTP